MQQKDFVAQRTKRFDHQMYYNTKKILSCGICGSHTQLDLTSVFELEKIDLSANKKKFKVDSERESKNSLIEAPKSKGDFGKTPSRSLNDSSHTNASANKFFC